jgi:hypothetical protein
MRAGTQEKPIALGKQALGLAEVRWYAVLLAPETVLLIGPG